MMAETRKTFQIRQPQDVRYSGHGSGGMFTARMEWDASLAARLNGNLAEAQKYVDQTCIEQPLHVLLLSEYLAVQNKY